MQLIMVSIFDKAAAAYNRPFFVPAVGLAIRQFQDEVNRAAEGNPLYSHPDDFELYQMGIFYDDSGKTESLPNPQFLCSGSQMLTPTTAKK